MIMYEIALLLSFVCILLLTWTLQLLEVNSSLVIDSVSQKGLYINDYCPKMPFCAEGAHVMCMYYDPNRVFGPQCSSPMSNVTMTSELATKLVEVTNAIRGKLAMGVEKGQGGVQLPRAYGMFKLQWDNELATFAQVLARQCLLRHDMCRASKRFPNPSQAVGKTRFTYPDWHPAGTKERHYAPGLSDVKVTYAITSVMKNWYQHKAAVTAEMINHYPDWDLTPDRKDGRFYMDMVYSASTHMGCGISAYGDYGYNDNKSKLNSYGILTICNFSGSPKKGKAVYHLEPDVQSSPCGCPPNTVEDENCLCSFVDESTHCAGTDCDQPVVIMPIFTVEDAPAHKLMSKPRAMRKDYEERSNAIAPPHSLEYLDYPQNGSNNEHPIVKVLNGIMNGQHLENQDHKPRASNRKVLDKPETTLQHKQGPASKPGYARPRMDHAYARKTSIFSRSVLLGTSNSNKFTLKDFKKDVVPRKDFSKAKHLVNNYVESTKNYTNIQHRRHVPEDRIIKLTSSTTENINGIKEHVLIYNYDNETLHAKHDEIHRHHEKGRDSKLMILLDKLEKEVQHIELKGNKKELFDAKIRKIYDSVVGRSSSIPSHKFDHEVILENGINGEIDHDNGHTIEAIDEHKHEVDEKMYDDIGKTMIDDVGHNHHDETLRNSIDEDSDGPKNRRRKVKSRTNIPYDTERELERDYERHPRENTKSNSQTDKLINGYGDSDNEYKPYRFPERRQSYKNKMQDHSYENFKMNRFSDDEGIRREKRLKHTREYYKNRNNNNVDNLNNNQYRRHQVTEDVEDNILSPERRKYYQERLENLERKIHSPRSRKYRPEEPEHRRRTMRVQSSDDEAPRRPSKSRLEHFDMRGRSRFIHGY